MNIQKKQDFITLGIETSCDETGAAVFSSANGLLSHALYSQIELHKQIGGVIPEIASRSQLEKIQPIIELALQQADLTIQDIDVLAVTNKPGLAGSLLVGVCFAKSLAFGYQKKIIGINHLEGHAFSSFLEHDVPFPHLCLTASGGHTSLYLITDFGEYSVLGVTQDDAAGEAFDKISKMLNLGYPGGPIIEQRARLVNYQDFFHYPRTTKTSLDFSFSGLKTAALYDLVKRGAYNLSTKQLTTDDEQLKNEVSSSLLVCIADIFVKKIALALQRYAEVKAVTFVGGVACNKHIASRIRNFCEPFNVPVYIPSPKFCTDNGAMIAFVGNYKAEQGKFSDLSLDLFE